MVKTWCHHVGISILKPLERYVGLVIVKVGGGHIYTEARKGRMQKRDLPEAMM
jgi:hypothetical protein